MTFDTIAFTQDELDNALNLCCTSIGLCDNDFILQSHDFCIDKMQDMKYIILN